MNRAKLEEAFDDAEGALGQATTPTNVDDDFRRDAMYRFGRAVLRAIRALDAPEPEAKPKCARCGATDWSRGCVYLGRSDCAAFVASPFAASPAPVPFEGLAGVFIEAAYKQQPQMGALDSLSRKQVAQGVEAVVAEVAHAAVKQVPLSLADGFRIIGIARDYQP